MLKALEKDMERIKPLLAVSSTVPKWVVGLPKSEVESKTLSSA